MSVVTGTSHQRSLADWKKLSREALSLECNAVNIDSTGSPAVLRQRLFDHYNLLHITTPVVETLLLLTLQLPPLILHNILQPQ